MATSQDRNAPTSQFQPPPPVGWGPQQPPVSTPPPAPGAWPPPQPHPQPPGQYHQPPGQHRGQWGYAAPGAEAERRPSVATLLLVTPWRLGIAGLAWYYAQTGKEETMSSESLSYLSNVGVALGFVVLASYPIFVAGRRHEPRTGWLRGALTIMMLLVGLVFVVGMGEEPDGPHAVIPTLVLVDWLFVGRNQFRTRWWEPFTWIVFPLLYLLYHQSNDVPLYEDILGEENIGTMVPILLVGCIVLGYLLYGAALLRRAATGATRE